MDSLALREGVTSLISTLGDITFFSGLDSDSDSEDEVPGHAVRLMLLYIVLPLISS